jgi:hypothetical protein
MPGARGTASGLPVSRAALVAIRDAREFAPFEERPDAGTRNELIVSSGSGPEVAVTGVVTGTVGVLAGVAIGGLKIGVLTTGAGVGEGAGVGTEATPGVPLVPCVGPWPGGVSP